MEILLLFVAVNLGLLAYVEWLEGGRDRLGRILQLSVLTVVGLVVRYAGPMNGLSAGIVIGLSVLFGFVPWFLERGLDPRGTDWVARIGRLRLLVLLAWGRIYRAQYAAARILKEARETEDDPDAELAELEEELGGGPARNRLRAIRIAEAAQRREFDHVVELVESAGETLWNKELWVLRIGIQAAVEAEAPESLERFVDALAGHSRLDVQQAELVLAQVYLALAIGDAPVLDQMLSHPTVRDLLGDRIRFLKPFWLGRTHRRAGRTEEAQACFDEAVRAVDLMSDRWRTILEEVRSSPVPAQDPVLRAAARRALLLLSGRTRRQSRPSRMRQGGRVGPTLVGVLVVIHLIVFLLGNWIGLFEAYVRLGAEVNVSIQWFHQYWRFFTSIFLHAPWILHILTNALVIYFFCRFVEGFYGAFHAVAIFLLSGVLGSMASGLLAGHPISLGASGGAMGLLGAVGTTMMQHGEAFPESARRRFLNLLVVMIGVVIATGLMEPQINNAAHVGGLLAGALYVPLLRPARQSDGNRRLRQVGWVLIGLSVAGVLGWAVLDSGSGYPWEVGQTRRVSAGPVAFEIPVHFTKTEEGWQDGLELLSVRVDTAPESLERVMEEDRRDVEGPDSEVRILESWEGTIGGRRIHRLLVRYDAPGGGTGFRQRHYLRAGGRTVLIDVEHAWQPATVDRLIRDLLKSIRET